MPDISLTRVHKLGDKSGSGATEPRLNVIFVHGLGGDPVTTWCHEGGAGDAHFWPRWLAEDIEGAAVYTLGYPADKAAWNTGWPIATAAVAVLDKLMSSRELRASKCAPIAFVCHSLGGLIVKKLVLTAHLDRVQNPRKGEFLDRIAGVAFLATPHDGSTIANVAEAARWFVSKSVQDLKASDTALLELGHDYRDRILNREAKIRHRVYFETAGVAGAKVVAPASADPALLGARPIPINRDHTGICKPVNRDDPVYEGVAAFLEDEVLSSKGLGSLPGEIAPTLRSANEPAPQTEYFISYAWNDASNRTREADVDRFCAAAVDKGIKIIRDKDDMRHGDRISKFMERIGRGDRVFIFLSDKYLRSAYCMHELFDVWRNCGEDADTFIARTRVFVLPCAKIKTAVERAQYAVYWRKEFEKIGALVKQEGAHVLSDADLVKHRLMSRFVFEAANVLDLVHDILKPRDFAAFVKYGFDDTPGGQILVVGGGDQEPADIGESVQGTTPVKQNDAPEPTEILQDATTSQTPFDRARYVAEIERLFRSSPSIIEKVEKSLDKAPNGRAIWSSLKPNSALSGYEARADVLVRTLVEQNLSPEDGCAVLDTALRECADGGNEEEVLIGIVCWYLPICCDVQKADEARRQYEKGDVNLIKFPAAHAMSADSHMAPVDERPLAVKRDTEGNLVGKCQIPSPPPRGLEATYQEELLKAAEEYAVSTFIPDFSGQAVPRAIINKIMKDNVRRETLYFLFKSSLHKGTDVERIAMNIRQQLPWVATLLLSNDPNDVGHDAYLFSKLREFLKRI